jgi:Tol biopolymer transport system component
MRKSLLVIALLYPTLLHGQAGTLTIDDLLDGVGQTSSGRGRNAEGISTNDGKYTVIHEQGKIALKPTGGGADVVLTSSKSPKSELALSPDGQQVAYVSQGQVWVVALAGGDPLQLTHDAAGPGDPRGATDHHPQWNPKGDWILYESGRKGFNELYAVSRDGKMLNLLAATEIYRGKDIIANNSPDKGDAVASDRFDSHPLWSPDGTRISYTERSREFFSGKLKILPFNQKTGAPAGPAIDIYTSKNDPGGAWAINTAAWSPDGQSLQLFCRRRTGTRYGLSRQQAVSLKS